MKIIELLNKIANNEEVPKEIMFRGEMCSFDNEDKDYYCQEYGYIVWHLIDNGCNMYDVLDTELDIIEEKPISLKPFKNYLEDTSDLPQIDKDNRIIEYIHQMSLKINYLLEKESDK